MLTSIYGGFGGFQGATPTGEDDEELPPDEKQTMKQTMRE
jgi:hypothetical protein